MDERVESVSMKRHKDKSNVIPFPSPNVVDIEGDIIVDLDDGIIKQVVQKDDITSWAGEMLDLIELTTGVDIAGPKSDLLIHDLEELLASHFGFKHD